MFVVIFVGVVSIMVLNDMVWYKVVWTMKTNGMI